MYEMTNIIKSKQQCATVGKGEVECSIHSGGTIEIIEISPVFLGFFPISARVMKGRAAE